MIFFFSTHVKITMLTTPRSTTANRQNYQKTETELRPVLTALFLLSGLLLRKSFLLMRPSISSHRLLNSRSEVAAGARHTSGEFRARTTVDVVGISEGCGGGVVSAQRGQVPVVLDRARQRVVVVSEAKDTDRR